MYHGLIFVQKAFFLGLFFGETYFWRGLLWEGIFSFQNGLVNNNLNILKHQDYSLEQLKTANINSPWAHIRKGLLVEGYLHQLGAYFPRGLLMEFYTYFTLYRKILLISSTRPPPSKKNKLSRK